MEIDSWNLYKWIRNVRDKKVIIFGSDDRAEKLYHKLALLDIRVEYFVDDIVEKGELCGCDVCNYFELLYEDRDKIGLVVIKPEDLEKLFHIGVCKSENVDNCLLMFRHNWMKGLYAVDPILGYNVFGDAQYPGFVLFGDRNAKHTIVTLGGSTTDAVYSAIHGIKCWSEFLMDRLEAEGLSVRILCGGVAAHKASQELLKLIRDVIPLQPDMVIIYDGFNELADTWRGGFGQNFLFLHFYQKELFAMMSQSKSVGMSSSKYIFGIDSKWNAYVVWKNSAKMMHMLCSGYGIKHLSVLQPSFYNQVGNMGGKSDWEIWMNNRLSDENQKDIEHFFCEKDNDEWDPEWLRDFRAIFQGIDEVYYDSCHCNNKGNKIIADKIFELIKESMLWE